MVTLGGERIVSATPIAVAGGRIIASPFQFYLDGADNVRIEGWNSLTGVTLQVFGRFFRDDGTVQVFESSLPLTADRVRTVGTFPAVRGYLLNLTLSVIGATPKLGQTFGRVSIVRGFTGATIVVGTLLQGYCAANQALAWPGSPIQHTDEIEGYFRGISGTIPAAGQPINEVVPTGAHWRLYALGLDLTTNAVAGNRRPQFMFDTGAGTGAIVHAVATVPASALASFFFSAGLTGNLFTPLNNSCSAMPPDVQLTSGGSFRVFSDLGIAGDQFTAVEYQVRERLEVN